MKTKSGEKRFLGFFKKKTTPAPAAPPLQDPVNTNSIAGSKTTEEATKSLADSSVPTSSILSEDVMPPRKGSIAQTSVIHYSPPGTVRASFPPSATSSVVSGGSDESSGTVVITRKSNIVLDDEESVISTPVSQYDESPIVQKPRSKRAAPPPPPLPPPPTAPISPITSIPTSSSSVAQSPAPKRDPTHFRQTSTNSIAITPPPPPPHRKQENEKDYEEMLKKLQNKFEEWHMVRLENGGSIKEERLKAEVLKEHEKLRVLLEKQITSDRPTSNSSLNNNNNVKKHVPLKIPQYGTFYAQPPPSSPSPPARVGAVPGGTVYQKMAKENPLPTTSKSPSASVQIGTPISPKIDENRNEVVSKKKVYATVAQNTEAVDRLRREVEEQRQREKEVKQYRNPKALEVQVKSPEPRRKENREQAPDSSQKTSPGPRMVEYKPMKSPGLPTDPEGIYEEIGEAAPPIPNTPPPKLSEYRKEQQSTAPRMPSVPSNGYVRLQMNGSSKKQAPVAPGPAPTVQKISQKPLTIPEYASSPKLLRKTPEPTNSTKIYASVPLKEEKRTSEKPQVHPQMTNGNSSTKEDYQGGMVSATSSSSSNYRKSVVNSPPMTRGASIDQNGYSGIATQRSTSSDPKNVASNVPSSPMNYRKIQVTTPMKRTPSEDQTNYGYASKTTINIVTSPYTQRKVPTPVSPPKSRISPMTRAMSTDQTTTTPPSPVNYRKISAPVTTSSQPTSSLRPLSTDSTQSPSINRRSQPTAGILSATSSKSTITSATSPPYPKGSMGTTVVSVKTTVPSASRLTKPTASGESFDISDVLKGAKLRKVGMPVERSGINVGKVLDAVPSSRPSTTPPPPPPPGPPPPPLAAFMPPTPQSIAPKNPDLRDSLMSEIREAGRLRAARVAQSA